MCAFQYYSKATKVTGKTSELLSYLASREKAIDEGIIGPHSKARIAVDRRMGRINLAVKHHARANVSDPFAAARIKNEMDRGLVSAAEVSTDALAQLAARGGHI